LKDSNEIQAAKRRLRETTEAALARLDPAGKPLASAQACHRMAETAEWKTARAILGFAPMPGELDIWPLMLEALARGAQVALPRFDRSTRTYTVCQIRTAEDVVPGYYGIREPGAHCPVSETKLLDLILVPGVAFDLQGRRLGRGKGFYDRLLKTWSGVTCGVGFDEQIVAEVPVEAHDVHLDCILTPSRFVRPGGLE
jgi:5-formyltetrahydrofolate cyclo-ligase